ncbi:putative translation initiation factor EIF-2B gamma subunit [Leptomonas seymouri]|uniref:Putative translation initiation factor EIF-2B gamma subunit n=1 Tax=Leptomonas seymouri TaxID=5684 RepID=A0A0N1I0M5_LEPSE|nr:putative translation initiation factor EIF-2B gamma subunit [Leptomonas seymouri]|eukprot:KPI82585.1 putative translation initiation factor EIF-2B gamma subunit [Leptomonas seymouri]
MIGVPSLIVLQNKIDLVTRVHAAAQYSIIRHYLATKTAYTRAPIIPVCVQQHLNIAYLLDYLVHIPVPPRMLRHSPYLNVLRSFDVSLPGPAGRDAAALKGGVVGGTLTSGVLCVGDEIEIRPGLLTLRRRDGALPKKADVLSGGEVSYVTSPPPGDVYSVPLRTTVVRLQAEQNELTFAVPGGLIAIGTTLDPSLTRQNKLRGQVVRLVRRGPVWRAANTSETGDAPSTGSRGNEGGGNSEALGDGSTRDSIELSGREGSAVASSPPMSFSSASPLPPSPSTSGAAVPDITTATPAAAVATPSALPPTQRSVHGCTGNDCGSASWVGMQVYQEVEIQFFLLRDIIGLPPARVNSSNGSNNGQWSYRIHPDHVASCSSHRRVSPLHEGESIVLSVGTLTTAATVLRTSRHAGRAICRLESPLSADPPHQRIVLARYVNRKVRIIGWGTIRRGVPVKLLPV